MVEEKLRGGARRESNYGRQSALKAPKQVSRCVSDPHKERCRVSMWILILYASHSFTPEGQVREDGLRYCAQTASWM